eukprot:2910192-Rhodomonas_salina.1
MVPRTGHRRRCRSALRSRVAVLSAPAPRKRRNKARAGPMRSKRAPLQARPGRLPVGTAASHLRTWCLRVSAGSGPAVTELRLVGSEPDLDLEMQGDGAGFSLRGIDVILRPDEPDTGPAVPPA